MKRGVGSIFFKGMTLRKDKLLYIVDIAARFAVQYLSSGNLVKDEIM